MPDNEHLFTLTGLEESLLQSILEWMPSLLTDVHVHAGLREHVLEKNGRIRGMSKGTFLYCSEDMHYRLDRNYGLNPRYRVVFAFPFIGIDVQAANEYILTWASTDRRILPFLTGTSNTSEEESYTIDQVGSGRFLGLKMYYDQGVEQARSVWEFYTRPVLDAANEAGMPIILHLPSNNLPLDIDELEEVSRSFPNLKIIVAHMGGILTTAHGFQSCCKVLNTLPNVYFDTSCCTNPGVFRVALDQLEENRVLYGSDQPYNALRIKAHVHPERGTIFMADRLYPWVAPSDWETYKHEASSVICYHVQSLLALREAMEAISHTELIDRVFYSNATDLLGLD